MFSTYKGLSPVHCVKLALRARSLESEPKGGSQISLQHKTFVCFMMEYVVLKVVRVLPWEVFKQVLNAQASRLKEKG